MYERVNRRDPARISLPPSPSAPFTRFMRPTLLAASAIPGKSSRSQLSILSFPSPSLPLPPSCPLFHESTTIDGSLRVVAGFHPHPLTSPRALSVGQRGGPGGKARSLSNADWSRFLSLALGGAWRHIHGAVEK